MDDDALIGIKKTRELLGDCSEMHIWRLCKSEKYLGLNFPRPVKINTRNYWNRREVLAWVKQQLIRIPAREERKKVSAAEIPTETTA